MTVPPPADDPISKSSNASFSAATEETFSPEEARLFELLDRYLNSLHSGDLVSRSVLVERHPALAKWMRCIELLDRLAPEGLAQEDEASEAAPVTGQAFGKYVLLEEI